MSQNFLIMLLFIVGGVLGQIIVPTVDPIPDDCQKVTIEGCVCRESWKVFGIEYTTCSNPNDLDGNWCAIEEGCYGDPAGKYFESFLNRQSYGYCPQGGCLASSCLTTLEKTRQISTFMKIAEATNVTGMISDSTVLAPTNQALDKVVSDLGIDLDNLSKKELKDLLVLLQLHIIKGFSYNASDLKKITEKQPTLVDGKFLKVQNKGETFRVIGSTVSSDLVKEVKFPDLFCNTAVFIVDAVLSDQ